MGAGDMFPQDVPADEGFKVMRKNWDSVCAWLACETQWRVLAVKTRLIYLGLDYQGVDVALRRSGTADTVFEDLQIMEREALAVFGSAT